MKRELHTRRAFLRAAVGSCILLSGCQTIHPGWSSMAYVEIEGVPLGLVREAALEVFTSEAYEVALNRANKLHFVREGNAHERLQYACYQETLDMRVEVTFESYGEDSVLVRADAFAIVGGFGRKETPVMRIARRPYRRLLERVAEAARAAQAREGGTLSQPLAK